MRQFDIILLPQHSKLQILFTMGSNGKICECPNTFLRHCISILFDININTITNSNLNTVTNTYTNTNPQPLTPIGLLTFWNRQCWYYYWYLFPCLYIKQHDSSWPPCVECTVFWVNNQNQARAMHLFYRLLEKLTSWED